MDTSGRQGWGAKKKEIKSPRVTALLEPEANSKVTSGLTRDLTIKELLFCLCMTSFTFEKHSLHRGYSI